MSLHRTPRGGRPMSRDALELWLRSPRGRRVLELESREVARVLPEVFGRHVLQIGSWGLDDCLLRSAETLHHAVLGTVAGFGAGAVVEPDRLPIASKSVDAIVLAHTLEFARSPHNLLREAHRVLSDRGRLFVLGFNPYGNWGLRQRLGLRYRAFPEGARFYSVGRLSDWLELLDLERVEVRRFGVGFPWRAPHSDSEAWSLSSWTAPLAESYLIVARKRVLPMNFVGRVARVPIKSLVGLPSPAARLGRNAQNRNPADELPPDTLPGSGS